MPRYRPDIDGLRGLALLAVMFFHTKVPGFSGGHVGVDVFFVISGFLITSIIRHDFEGGGFSFARFYERRARRLLPALFCVLVACFVAGWLVLMPSDYRDMAQSATATIGFWSNFRFMNTLGYFVPAAEFRPLLHTWSLAVEEQFYIVFPVCVLVLLRQERRVALAALGLGFALSLAWSVYAVARWPGSAFYMLPARGWELLAGCLIAYGAVPAIRQARARAVLAAAGLAMIAVAVATYTRLTAFPGLAAMLPCLGTALLVHSGMSGSTPVHAALAWRPLVGIGLISYGLYLWHWPALVFLRFFTGTAGPAPELTALAMAIAGVAAILSYRFVERPLRRPGSFSRRRAFGLAGAGMAASGMIAAAIWAGEGVPARIGPETAAMIEALNDVDPTRDSCFDVEPGPGLCRVGNRAAPVSFLLWGDSHAAALKPAVDAAARRAGVSGLFAGRSACPPLIGVWRLGRSEGDRCPRYNDRVADFLRGHPSMTVFLAGRWALYATGRFAAGEPGTEFLLADAGTGRPHEDPSSAVFRRGLERTLRAVSGPGRSVVVIGGVPEIGWQVPRTLATARHLGRPAPAPPILDQVEARNRSVLSTIDGLARTYAFRHVPLADLLCTPVCQVLHGGRPVYVDDDHLSLHAAREILAPALVARLWPVTQSAAEGRPASPPASVPVTPASVD